MLKNRSYFVSHFHLTHSLCSRSESLNKTSRIEKRLYDQFNDGRFPDEVTTVTVFRVRRATPLQVIIWLGANAYVNRVANTKRLIKPSESVMFFKFKIPWFVEYKVRIHIHTINIYFSIVILNSIFNCYSSEFSNIHRANHNPLEIKLEFYEIVVRIVYVESSIPIILKASKISLRLHEIFFFAPV